LTAAFANVAKQLTEISTSDRHMDRLCHIVLNLLPHSGRSQNQACGQVLRLGG